MVLHFDVVKASSPAAKASETQSVTRWSLRWSLKTSTGSSSIFNTNQSNFIYWAPNHIRSAFVNFTLIVHNLKKKQWTIVLLLLQESVQNLHFRKLHLTTTTTALIKINVCTPAVFISPCQFMIPGAGRESASVFVQYKRRQSLQPQLSDKLTTKQTLTHHNSIPASAFTCGFSWTPSHAQRTSILSYSEPPEVKKNVEDNPSSTLILYLSWFA